jgi:aminopeptidase N
MGSMLRPSTEPRQPLNILFWRLVLASLSILSLIGVSFADRRERIVKAWRPLHYDVSLNFDERLTEFVSARAEVTFVVQEEGLTHIDLDFGDLPVDFVTEGESPATFEQHSGVLLVSLVRAAKRDERLSIAIGYHGRPKDGLILTSDKDGKPSATGDNWPDRVHHWIPCLDHPSAKATVRFTVTAPARDMVIANGALTTTTMGAPNTRTWVYTENAPIPPYCMVVAIGEGARVEPQTRGAVPLYYYVPQSDRAAAIKGFAPAPFALSLFSEEVAEYPYEKLALIVAKTRFGGMENASAIVFPDTLFATPTKSEALSRKFNIRLGIEDVVAHEIAHQWFGDSVTESTWSDLWLSEGFATYFSGLFMEHFEDEKTFRTYMQTAAENYFQYEKKHTTPIHDEKTEDLFALLNPNNYQKGAWVLHMLRNHLGDEAFFRGLRLYYTGHRGGTATTDDLRTALEKASSSDLGDFFTRWVYGSGHPRYDVSWKWELGRGTAGTVALNLRQTQDGPVFLDPVPIEILTATSTRREMIRPTGRDATFRLEMASRPSEIRVDPNNTLLRELTMR